jgi:hypothetical protein
MSVLHDLAAVAQDAGCGTPAVDLFTAMMPDDPVNVAAMQQYGGLAPRRIVPCNITHEIPSIQVAVRAATYEDAEARAYALWHALTFSNRVINGVTYLDSAPQQAPFLMRRDENGRPVCGFNLYVVCQPSR